MSRSILFEEIADSRKDEKERQIALWQAAGLYEKGVRRDLIVPWKKANADNLMGNPVANLVGDSLAPIDHDVFRREVEHYDRLSACKAVDPIPAE